MTPSTWEGAILSSVIAALIWATIGKTHAGLARAVARQRPEIRYAVAFVPLIAFSLLTLGVHRWFHEQWLFVFCAGILGMLWITWTDVRRYALLGIVGIDDTLLSGISPRRGLECCSTSLDFLGVGAAKVTAEGSAFDAAMQRCSRPGRPIRLLLCPPDHPELEKFARQAGVGSEKYRESVRQSLAVIARQKRERERNIEVRFYSTLPLFRLMFINDDLCLASHYYFGDGDGSSLPQLHVRRIGSGRDIESLYYPLHEYFESMWKQSRVWDFSL